MAGAAGDRSGRHTLKRDVDKEEMKLSLRGKSHLTFVIGRSAQGQGGRGGSWGSGGVWSVPLTKFEEKC